MNYLVVVAHPDDEVLGAGATIHKLIRQGHSVAVAIMVSKAAARANISVTLDKDEEEREGRFIRQERYAGACSRSFYVGDIRPEEVKCKYEFGVLRVTLPKPTARVVESPSHIAID